MYIYIYIYIYIYTYIYVCMYDTAIPYHKIHNFFTCTCYFIDAFEA